MLLSIEGEEATGKTTLAYSAPLPIVGFALDMGFERAIMGGKYKDLFDGCSINMVKWSKAADAEESPAQWQDSDITVFELPQPIQLEATRLKGFRHLYGYFIQVLAKALMDEAVCSVVVDTMTVARRVKAQAHLEYLQNASYDQSGNLVPGKNPRVKLQQIEYGVVNDAMRDIYTMGAGVRKNLIVVHHLTDEYSKTGPEDSVPTGKRILEGLTGTNRFVDVALRMEKDPKKHSLKCELHKVGYSLDLEGQQMNNPTWNSIVRLISSMTGDRIKFDERSNGEVE